MRAERVTRGIWLGLCVMFLACACTSRDKAAPAAPTAQAGEQRISGPYTHGNLSIFLIHGADKLKGRTFLTLQDAMEKKQVVVHETGNVNELAIENVGETPVYVQSGDIVKGGKQDRTFAQDFVVAAKSGKMPVASFCVESGRWRQRGDEQLAAFASAEFSLSGKDLKLAAKRSMRQEEVWENVVKEQQKLSTNVGENVAAQQSATSYQLSLENKKLADTTQGYIKALAPIIDGKDDVIGYAFTINGKMNSADVYGSAALFRQLWPKLLKSSSVEAIAELKKDAKYEVPTTDVVVQCLGEAEKGKSTEQSAGRVKLLTKDAPGSILFETRDGEQADAYLHRNYIKK